MKSKFVLLLLIPFFTCLQGKAQDFSGLLNKKLTPINDVGSLVESGLGSLLGGGKIKGGIDSILVVADAEQQLQLKIFYNGFENAVVKTQVTDAQKAKQDMIKKSETTLPATASPFVCTMNLNTDFPKGQLVESSFLKIEVAKSANKPGQVFLYSLNKKWKADLEPENVVVRIKPTPIGNTSRLRESETKDVIPSKRIVFDAAKLYYNPKLDIKTQPLERRTSPSMEMRRTTVPRVGGQQATTKTYTIDYLRKLLGYSDNISGTWINTDAATNGITKIIITNNNQLQVFGKCSPTDCDWGKTTLTDNGNNTFKAVYKMGFKVSTMSFSYANNQLNLANNDAFTDARGVRNYSYSFKKNIILTTMILSPQLTIKEYGRFADAATVATTDRSAKGPDKSSLYLWAGLSSDIDIEKPQDISNINMNIFPDKNSASGVYYFLPADYHLRYETKDQPEDGYNLKIQYGGSSSPDDTAPVRMSARLTAGLSSKEIEFIKELLKANIPSAKELRPMPLSANPVFSFQSYLTSQYNIPQSKIAVESSTDLSNDIRVAWQTDAETKEFIQVALTSGEGIAASVILKPQAADIIDQQIPVTINLVDGRTLGKITLDPTSWRSKNWKNTRPYPLQLKHLNILKLSETDKSPIIYSWSLDNTVVPSKAQVAFDPSLVPSWLDRQPSVLMWIDYAIVDCKPCNDKVITAITQGVASSTVQKIQFTIPPVVFDSMNASYFMVSIRSKQIEPNGQTVKELSSALKITKDADKVFSAGPLYIPANGSLAFEYKLTLATTDGEFKTSDVWIPATDKEILLGKTKVKEIFSRSN